MLIHNFKEILLQLNIKGIIHIGAHNCEEQDFYNSININNIFGLMLMQKATTSIII